jgi:ABC-type lipoprotein release transport system permease subunit
MSSFLNIARTGSVAILLSPLRSAVTVVAVIAVLVPYLVGTGLAEGLRQEALIAIGVGVPEAKGLVPDLYVAANRFGRRVPIPVSLGEPIRQFDGVTQVVPRIVGRITVGTERVEAVLVGLPREALQRFGSSVHRLSRVVDGKLPGSRRGEAPELVIGSSLARELNLQVGTVIPPIHRSGGGEKTPRIIGIFESDVSLWQSRMILTTFESAGEIFDQSGLATDLLVYCRAGQPESIRLRILGSFSESLRESTTSLQHSVTSRSDLESLIPAGLGHREGVFNLLFVAAFGIGILVIMVTSGFGRPERRREIGILKATGWQTDEILLRSLVESLLLGLASAALSILLAWIWLNGFDGYWIAGIFLAGVETTPTITVPYVLSWQQAALAVLIACLLVTTGSAYSTWRTAVTSPAEAMR